MLKDELAQKEYDITPTYKTSDGREFNDEERAQNHAEFLERMSSVNDYAAALEKAGWKGSALTRQVNAAKAFRAFQINGAMPEPPKEKKEEEKPKGKPQGKDKEGGEPKK